MEPSRYVEKFGIIDLNFRELYPDILRDVREYLHPSNLVIDTINEKTPDDDCIIISWKDDEREHVYRFLKPGVVRPSEALMKLTEARKAVEAESILVKNFPRSYKESIGEMRSFIKHRLAGNERPQLLIITGPYYSGKSFIADVIISRIGGRSKCCSIPMSERFSPEYETVVTEALKDRKLMIYFDLLDDCKSHKNFSALAQKYLLSTDVLLTIDIETLQKLDPKLINNDCVIIACENGLQHTRTAVEDPEKIMNQALEDMQVRFFVFF